MPSYRDLGTLVQQKYPQYANMDPEQLGNAVAQRYPQYQSQFQPQKPQGLVSGAFHALADPGIGYLKQAGEAINQVGNVASQRGNQEFLRRVSSAPYNTLPAGVSMPQGPQMGTENISNRVAQAYQPKFLSQNDIKDYSTVGGAIKQTAKRTAGGASYFIPGGQGVGGAVLQGAAMSGLSEFSKPNSTLSSVLGATATGGVVGGGLHAAGELAGNILGKAKPALSTTGNKLKEEAFVQSVGKPTAKEGGEKLIRNIMKNPVYDTKDSVSLLNSAQGAIDGGTEKLVSAAQELTNKGVKVDVGNTIKSFVQDKVDNSPSLEKDAWNKVLDIIKKDFPNNKADPTWFIKVRQSIGNKAYENGVKGDLLLKDALNELYGKMQETYGTALEGNGIAGFKDINKAVSEAINVKKFAERAANVVPNAGKIGLIDTGAALAGGALSGGNPVAAMGTLAAKRAIESPKIKNVVGDALVGLGNAQMPKISPTVQKALSAVGGAVNQGTTRLASSAVGNALSPVGLTDNNVNQNNNQQSFNNPHDQNVSQIPQVVKVDSKGNKILADGTTTDPSGNWVWDTQNNKWQPNQQAQQSPQLGQTNGLMSPEVIAKAMQYDLQATGGKAYGQLKQLYDLSVNEQKRLNPVTKGPKARFAQQQAGKQALDSLNTLDTGTNSGSLFGSSVPYVGKYLNQDYSYAKDQVLQALKVLRPGFSEARLQNELPQLTDSTKIRASKLKSLRDLFTGFANSDATGDIPATDVTAGE